MNERGVNLAQAALDEALGDPEAKPPLSGARAEKRAPITREEQEAVLKRFGLVNLLDLVVLSALRASDKNSMTVDSSYPGVRVVVRVTHPRVPREPVYTAKKAKSAKAKAKAKVTK